MTCWSNVMTTAHQRTRPFFSDWSGETHPVCVDVTVSFLFFGPALLILIQTGPGLDFRTTLQLGINRDEGGGERLREVKTRMISLGIHNTTLLTNYPIFISLCQKEDRIRGGIKCFRSRRTIPHFHTHTSEGKHTPVTYLCVCGGTGLRRSVDGGAIAIGR